MIIAVSAPEVDGEGRERRAKNAGVVTIADPLVNSYAIDSPIVIIRVSWNVNSALSDLQASKASGQYFLMATLTLRLTALPVHLTPLMHSLIPANIDGRPGCIYPFKCTCKSFGSRVSAFRHVHANARGMLTPSSQSIALIIY